MTKEQNFYKALQDVFIGARIEGEGGFVNLMRIKSNYYQKIEEILKKDIEEALKNHPKFKDELFDKLYSFFSRYFTQSGSIYFNSTPFHNNIYEKVYTDEKDVILFWKTQMLYYVKTDRIFRSLPVEFDGFKFYFDASKIESKKANEKRSLIFELKQTKDDGTIVFMVLYSEKGTKTKQDEILKALKKKGIAITEEQLERSLRIFEKQSEVDFFINKNAKAFLQEQFKLWSYQYFWDGAKDWGAERVNQLQILKDIAFKIIDFISQFEDELVKIWNKPKFVKNSNYVITLDRILSACHPSPSCHPEFISGSKEMLKQVQHDRFILIEKILKAEGMKEQVKEWQELGIVDENFSPSVIANEVKQSQILRKEYEHLPIDTKYFKDLELEILSLFDDLDNQLDGWLAKSENYQALNTILPRFKEKVQTIYIDPPFNTGKDFDYVDRFQDSSWLSLMENRIEKAKYLLHESGSFYLHLDSNADYYGRFLLNYLFKENNFLNEVIWDYRTGGAPSKKGAYSLKHDAILFFAKNVEKLKFHKFKERIYYEKPFFGIERDEEGKYYADVLLRDVLGGEIIALINEQITKTNLKPVLNVSAECLHFDTQKSEGLLKILLLSTSNEGDLVMDFFLGSGTTTAVAHKLGRKWLGVEMGEHFYSVVLPRMKKVLAYDKSGISKDVKEYQGGGFFKYYELEQYEEALANCKYEDGDLFTKPSASPYQEYVFMKDEKMLKALEIDYKNNKVKVDLSKLYPDIDITETLSNLTGKWIKRIADGEVEFADGTKINTKSLDYKLIKPLIWW